MCLGLSEWNGTEFGDEDVQMITSIGSWPWNNFIGKWLWVKEQEEIKHMQNSL
jgi:hypothetical protein